MWIHLIILGLTGTYKQTRRKNLIYGKQIHAKPTRREGNKIK